MHSVRSLFIQHRRTSIDRSRVSPLGMLVAIQPCSAFECLKKGRCKSDALDNFSNPFGLMAIGPNRRHWWELDSPAAFDCAGRANHSIDYWSPRRGLTAKSFTTERPTTLRNR